MAAGDVLVTIKAKYESVNVALDQLTKIDKVITKVNKTGINFNVKGGSRQLGEVSNGLSKVEGNLERVKRAASQFEGKALGFGTLRASISELDGQIKSAAAAFNTLSEASGSAGKQAERTQAALQVIAGTYKKIRLENAAMRRAGTKLFVGSDEGKGKNVIQKWDKMIGEIKAAGVEGKVNLQKVNSSLEEVNFLMDYAIEDSSKWNDLIKLKNDLLRTQQRLQDKINKQLKEAVSIEKTRQSTGEIQSRALNTLQSGKNQSIGQAAFFPPDIQKLPGYSDMMKTYGPGGMSSAIDLAFKAQESTSGKYPVGPALQDILVSLEKFSNKLAALGGKIPYEGDALSPKYLSGIPGDVMSIPGAKSLQPGQLQTAMQWAYSAQESTKGAYPVGEALEDLISDVYYFSKRLKKLGGTTDKVDGAFVKLSNELTKQTQATGGGPGAEAKGERKRLTLEERFNRRFGESYGGDWGGKRFPSRRFRNMRRSMRRGVGSKMGQSMLLGGGFPMLFGGGPGAVGGSLLGSGMAGMMGMPSAGFGLQIAGSAIGTMLEAAHQSVVKLGDAIKNLSLDNLLESGIRVNAVMQIAIDKAIELGDYKKAEALMNKEIYQQTGLLPGVTTNIANNTALLGNAWGDVVKSVGGTLAILAAPFITALAGVLALVGRIFATLNTILSALATGVQRIGEWVVKFTLGEGALRRIQEQLRNLGGPFDQRIIQATKFNDELRKSLKTSKEIHLLQMKKLPETSPGNRLINLQNKNQIDKIGAYRSGADQLKKALPLHGVKVGKDTTSAKADYESRLKFIQTYKKELKEIEALEKRIKELEESKGKTWQNRDRSGQVTPERQELGDLRNEAAERRNALGEKSNELTNLAIGGAGSLLELEKLIVEQQERKNEALQKEYDQQVALIEIARFKQEQEREALAESRALELEQFDARVEAAAFGRSETLAKLDSIKEETEARTKYEQGFALLKKKFNAEQITDTEYHIQKEALLNTRNHELAMAQKRLESAEDQKNLELRARLNDAIASKLTQAIFNVVEGTETWREALSRVLIELGKILIQTILIESIKKAFSLGLFGDGGTASGGLGVGANDLSGSLGTFAKEGAYWGGGFKAFSQGGIATKPTLGLIGEGGEDEYIIPASKMDGAMERYSAGNRGLAVIPGLGGGVEGSGESAPGTAIVNYTGPTLNFEGDNYVPRSAIPDIINKAARQGATAGQRQTLSTLKNSRANRTRIGI